VNNRGNRRFRIGAEIGRYYLTDMGNPDLLRTDTRFDYIDLSGLPFPAFRNRRIASIGTEMGYEGSNPPTPDPDPFTPERKKAKPLPLEKERLFATIPVSIDDQYDSNSPIRHKTISPLSDRELSFCQA
ncbi:phosphate transporter 4, partial [Striga asiatica]